VLAPTLPNPSQGLKTGKVGGTKPIRWPRIKLPRLLDADDARVLGTVLTYSLLVFWAAIVLGAAVRVFLVIGFGGG